LIPQRNISLLAHRLAKAGSRGIPESLLERDYYLVWFLAELAESDPLRDSWKPLRLASALNPPVNTYPALTGET
jgi:hypothetical protein